MKGGKEDELDREERRMERKRGRRNGQSAKFVSTIASFDGEIGAKERGKRDGETVGKRRVAPGTCVK